MSELQCTIATPEQLVFQRAARSVVVPAVDGELGILPRHAPLVGMLGFGELRVETAGDASGAGGGKSRFFVKEGFLQILGDQVTVLAAEAVPLSELDVEKDEAALLELESSPPTSGASFEERERYQRSLKVAKARVRLGRKPS